MRRFLVIAAVSISTCATISPARAENWWTGFWGSVHDGWHRNNAWPEPFIYQDRETVAAPFGAMINKGWERQNLLGEYHFEDGAQGLKLNQAGQLNICWILTHMPQSQRIIFVQRGLNPAQTEIHLALAQQAAANILAPGENPAIAISNMDSTGWPAESVAAVGNKYLATTPDPRLAKPTGDSSGGSSGGASGGH